MPQYVIRSAILELTIFLESQKIAQHQGKIMRCHGNFKNHGRIVDKLKFPPRINEQLQRVSASQSTIFKIRKKKLDRGLGGINFPLNVRELAQPNYDIPLHNKCRYKKIIVLATSKRTDCILQKKLVTRKKVLENMFEDWLEIIALTRGNLCFFS